MPTPLDLKLIPKIRAVLGKYGTDAAILVPDWTVYSPATGKLPYTAPGRHTVKATPPEPYRKSYTGEQTIEDGDARTYIAGDGLTITPRAGFMVDIGSDIWRIVSANAIYSGTLVTLWELQLRR